VSDFIRKSQAEIHLHYDPSQRAISLILQATMLHHAMTGRYAKSSEKTEVWCEPGSDPVWV
jgi:hypothetical protein